MKKSILTTNFTHRYYDKYKIIYSPIPIYNCVTITHKLH